MIQITTSFLQNIFGAEPVRGNKVLEQKFDQIFYLFRGSYPSMKSGNHSLTMALSAMGFFLNAEAYFNKIDPKKGKDFIVAKKDEFLKYYNFDAVLADIRKGNEMLFLYNNSSPWINKLSAHGVIGKFHSIEFFSLHISFRPARALMKNR